MKLRILRSASQDIVDGHNFYEQQETGLGKYFVDRVFTDVDALLQNPGIHPKVMNRFHRVLVRKFPFAIFYQVESDLVLVHAVIDCRRDPRTILQKLLR